MTEPTLASGAAASVSDEGTSGSETTPDGSSFSPSDNGGLPEGFNPAWKPMLDKLPPEFHKIVEPDLRQWDQNFQQRTSEVQSQYEPYKELIDNQIPVETISAALQLAAVIEADPQGFYNQLGEFYKDQWGQGQDGSANLDDTFELGGQDQDAFDITQHPKFIEQQQQLQTIAQFLDSQIRSEEQQQADAALEQEEAALKEEFGDFDPEWVYPYAVQQQTDLKTAVQAYHTFVNKIRQTPTASSTAPAVFSPNGAIPSNQPNPAEMSSKDTKSLVASLLAAANQEG